MKFCICLLGSIFSFCLLSSCGNTIFIDHEHNTFTEREDYKKTNDIYKNLVVLKDKSSKATKIIVNKSTQRLKVYKNHLVILDTPCTTGKRGKTTPSGEFTVTSKIKNKKSNIFGRCYYKGKFIYGGDKRKCRARYTSFVGSSLPYWMRLTTDGIGIHASRSIKRYPASNGCIRVPYSIASTIYAEVNKYTPVSIQ